MFLSTILISIITIPSVAFGESVQVLDETNFDSIAFDPAKSVLVQFYRTYELCNDSKKFEPIYEKVAKTFENERTCVVAKVDVESERVLRAKYGVKFPTIWFFPQGSKVGYKYGGGRKEEDLINFLNRKCGTNRLLGGGINEQDGRFDAFDKTVEKFMQDSDSRESKISEIVQAIGTDSDQKKSGEYYVKVMKKVMEKGESHIQTEISRLESILSGYTTPDKRDQMLKQKNILNVFKKVIVKKEL